MSWRLCGSPVPAVASRCRRVMRSMVRAPQQQGERSAHDDQTEGVEADEAPDAVRKRGMCRRQLAQHIPFACQAHHLLHQDDAEQHAVPHGIHDHQRVRDVPHQECDAQPLQGVIAHVAAQLVRSSERPRVRDEAHGALHVHREHHRHGDACQPGHNGRAPVLPVRAGGGCGFVCACIHAFPPVRFASILRQRAARRRLLQ